LLLIPELVSQGLVREDFSMTNAVIAVATLFSVVLIVSVFTYLSRQVQQVVEIPPSILISNGALLTQNLDRESASPDEVLSQVRQSGLETLDQVKWAILESDGKISVVPKQQLPLPVTPPDKTLTAT
jgi:uncharacterized membrane protein YcaP (DUF421 family)